MWPTGTLLASQLRRGVVCLCFVFNGLTTLRRRFVIPTEVQSFEPGVEADDLVVEESTEGKTLAPLPTTAHLKDIALALLHVNIDASISFLRSSQGYLLLQGPLALLLLNNEAALGRRGFNEACRTLQLKWRRLGWALDACSL